MKIETLKQAITLKERFEDLFKKVDVILNAKEIVFRSKTGEEVIYPSDVNGFGPLQDFEQMKQELVKDLGRMMMDTKHELDAL